MPASKSKQKGSQEGQQVLLTATHLLDALNFVNRAWDLISELANRNAINRATKSNHYRWKMALPVQVLKMLT